MRIESEDLMAMQGQGWYTQLSTQLLLRVTLVHRTDTAWQNSHAPTPPAKRFIMNSTDKPVSWKDMPLTHHVPRPASRASRIAHRVSRIAYRVSCAMDHVSRIADHVERVAYRKSHLA